jgi:exodeoxyribonuclease VII large subunit
MSPIDESQLFDSLFDPVERRPLSVSELNASVRLLIESAFPSIWVEGEIVNFVNHASGHWYFTLKDGSSAIKCVCWRGTNSRIRYRPANGNAVRLRGKLTLWETAGTFQLSVESLEPSGEGELLAAIEQIKAKLQKEGLFDESLKRPLPFFPRKVGIVTSKSGAALHDILSVLDRRARSISVVIAPSLVQGEGAAESIRNALAALSKYNEMRAEEDRIDVAIVGRGGGSAEDLWAYNDETLARAIRASPIPIISAVGHEVDHTIADMVADVRAGTPSIAAEMVAAREEDLLSTFKYSIDRMTEIARRSVYDACANVDQLADEAEYQIECRLNAASMRAAEVASLISPSAMRSLVSSFRNDVERLDSRNLVQMSRAMAGFNDRFGLSAATLDALSPLAVIARGYSITQTVDGKIVRDESDVATGDRVKIRLAKGKIEADVVSAE